MTVYHLYKLIFYERFLKVFLNFIDFFNLGWFFYELLKGLLNLKINIFYHAMLEESI